MWPLCGFQEFPLLFHSKILDIIHCSNRLRVTNPIHRMFDDQVVHQCWFKHGPHRNICLTNCRSSIICFHPVEDDLAVHRFDVRQQHTTNHRLNIVNIPLPVVSTSIRCQVRNHILLPKLKPCVHSHIRWNKNIVMHICKSSFLQPVPCLWKCRNILLVALSMLIYKSCVIKTILPLADALAAFFPF